MNTPLLNQARRLSVTEQLELVEALWDDIMDQGAIPELTSAQLTELENRTADYEDNPDNVVPWNEVKAAALARLRQ